MSTNELSNFFKSSKRISGDINAVKFIDFKFLDLFGRWHHFQIPASELSATILEEGLFFDGSSIRAWQGIENSDMNLVPDPQTAFIDPFFDQPTLSLICVVRDPITGEAYGKDPRQIAANAVEYMKASGIADTAYFGPEAEFFMFSTASFESGSGSAYYFLDSDEAPWNAGETSGNMGYRIRAKEGYFPVAPHDHYQSVRLEMMTALAKLSIQCEAGHHEVAPSQHEINFRFGKLIETADNVQILKYVVKNIAKRNGLCATFMPKPVFGDNGSGMHVHQSLWSGGKPLFAGDSYAGLSETALYYIGGIIKHANAIAAFSNPTANSYRRLVPGFEAPINLAYSGRNRSASIRIPLSTSPQAKRVEFRCPDPSCNPYLSFSAMLMAGLDGIENKIHPGEPLDKDIYGLPPEELAKVPQMPGSLREALRSLEKNHDFLLKGDVFNKNLIESYINFKMEHEVKAIESRPTPHEFELYFDI